MASRFGKGVLPTGILGSKRESWEKQYREYADAYGGEEEYPGNCFGGCAREFGCLGDCESILGRSVRRAEEQAGHDQERRLCQ